MYWAESIKISYLKEDFPGQIQKKAQWACSGVQKQGTCKSPREEHSEQKYGWLNNGVHLLEHKPLSCSLVLGYI